MERPPIIKNYNPYRFLVIFYTVGLTGHLIPLTREFMLRITPLALLISVITILIPFIQKRQWKVLVVIILFGIAGFIAEIIGVKTGTLFGNYSYGNTLGPGLLGVPFTMILNWIIIFSGSVSLSTMIFQNKILSALSAAITSVFLDYIMEPVAIRLNYWNWESGYIPLNNYLTWGILVFIFSIIFFLFKLTIKSRLPAFLLVIQIIYFFILRIFVT